MHPKRILITTVAIALLGIVTWIAFRPAPIPVEMSTIDRGSMEITLTDEGRTHVHERYVVSAPVTAYRPRLNWHVGDRVKAGDLLVALQPSRSTALDPRSRAEAEAGAARAESALQAARTNADSAGARADLAQKEYLRLQDLFRAGTVSRQQLDQAEFELRDSKAHLRSADFAIDVAEHELEAARTRLSYTGDARSTSIDQIEISAPTDGVVLSVPIESEGVVQAGEPILEIGDPDTMEAHIDLLTNEAVQLEPGMPVRLVRWGGDMPLDGEVQLVEPAGFTKISALGVEEQRARVIVSITSPRDMWRSLGDGYRIEAEFILWSEDDVLRIPTSALFREGGQWMVFTVNDGIADTVTVAIGQRGETHSEIIDGLGEGAMVVQYPGSSLRNGSRVVSFNESR